MLPYQDPAQYPQYMWFPQTDQNDFPTLRTPSATLGSLRQDLLPVSQGCDVYSSFNNVPVAQQGQEWGLRQGVEYGAGLEQGAGYTQRYGLELPLSSRSSETASNFKAQVGNNISTSGNSFGSFSNDDFEEQLKLLLGDDEYDSGCLSPGWLAEKQQEMNTNQMVLVQQQAACSSSTKQCNLPSQQVLQYNNNQKPRKRKKTLAGVRNRFTWSLELHTKFVLVVQDIGLKNAVPKAILKRLQGEGLTRENVASHLQKYRQRLRRLIGLNASDDMTDEQSQIAQEKALQECREGKIFANYARVKTNKISSNSTSLTVQTNQSSNQLQGATPLYCLQTAQFINLEQQKQLFGLQQLEDGLKLLRSDQLGDPELDYLWKQGLF